MEVIDLARNIGETGILLFIAALFVMFVLRTINSFFEKDKVINGEIVPRLEAICTDIKNSKQQIISLITNHNSSSATKIGAIKNDIVDIYEDNKKILQQIEALKETTEDLENELEELSNEYISTLKDYNVVLADMKVNCVALCSRDMLVNQLVIRGKCSKEDIETIIIELTKNR